MNEGQQMGVVDGQVFRIPVTATDADALLTRPAGPDLDAMLTREEAAEWLRISPRQLVECPSIPKFQIGHKTARWHPRTIVASLALQAGANHALIAASFGVDLKQQP